MRSAAPSVLNKIFFVILSCTFISYLVLLLRSDNGVIELKATDAPGSKREILPKPDKYILLWTGQKGKSCAPFDSFGTGKYAFKRINCRFKDCFITENRTLLGDYTKFDAILFNGRQILNMSPKELPDRRSPHQIYVFVQLESADRFPVCQPSYDGFFNRTFTYKRASDFPWPYFLVALQNGTVVGPGRGVSWIKEQDMRPVGEELKVKLRRKKRAAAWFVSNCESRSLREQFVKNLQRELRSHKHEVDIYGRCGPLTCPRGVDVCTRYIEEDYYFYLALENSISEDYVTEKVLTALQHDAVPVVLGGADYSRFLPPGSYLNGRDLGPVKLAAAMLDLMGNKSRYENMFRWRQHYKYLENWPPPLCSLCEDLHKGSTQRRMYDKFRSWWSPGFKKRCEKGK